MSRTRLALAAPLVIFAACSKPSGSSDAPPAVTTPATTATTAPPPAATPTASARPDPPTYAPHKVSAGMVGEVWTPGFEIVRDKGNLGLSYLDAQNKCTSTGKSLCTDTEWQRACDADAELSKIETWTTTGMGDSRFVVRGGGDAACRSRDVASGADKKPDRAAVCCDRTVGIKTTNHNEAFLKISAKRILDYEAAIKNRDSLALASQYDDKVTFLGKDYANAELVKKHEAFFKQLPDQWTIFDSCTVSIDKTNPADHKLRADCRTMFHRKGEVVVAMQRLVWGGNPTMKVQVIGDAVTTGQQQAPDGTVIEEKETKERVGVLLASD